MNSYWVYLDTEKQESHRVEADGHSISNDLVLSFWITIRNDENTYTTTEYIAVFKNWAWFQKI